MATCKECLHFEPCRDYGNILDPIHGGMICDSFKPAADVVEVVRCKDCVHSCFIRSCSKYECRKGFGALKFSNDFCSYGERRKDELSKATNS